MKAQMKQLAYFDALTSLPNRNHFIQWAKQPFPMKNASVFLLDVDRFKWVNDHLGHQIGDILLKEVASRLKQVAKEGDFLCRKGGNEFVFITGEKEEEVLHQLLQQFAHPFYVDEEELFLTISIGVCKGSVDVENTLESLVKCADHAMLEAKKIEGVVDVRKR